MLRKTLLILLTIIVANIYSAENKQNTFLIDFIVQPDIQDKEILKGASINWNRNILEKLYIGASLRLMQQNYTSLYGSIGTELLIKDRFIIPIESGFGVEVFSLNFAAADDELDLNLFAHLLTGFEWIIDDSWNYYVHLIYNYNILNEDTHRTLGSIGVKYRF